MPPRRLFSSRALLASLAACTLSASLPARAGEAAPGARAAVSAGEDGGPTTADPDDGRAHGDDAGDDPLDDVPILETTVTTTSEGRALAESAQAVSVVDTSLAKKQAADMGEVLRRTQGVAIRRGGGLGSSTRFSLAGLYDEQIRFFVDGVPLEIAGYGFDLANVPVNLVDRVEIYRGVVPIRFGADALGGAVHLVSDQRLRRTSASASLQGGSFGTLRTTALGRVYEPATGFVGSASAFYDRADNDYVVDVEIPDERGRLVAASVPRFHDAYEAWGVGVEAGVVDQAFADRLTLRLHRAEYEKQLQHNVVMTVPYGEVSYGEDVTGAVLRWTVEDAGLSGLGIELTSSWARQTTSFRDDARWVYDWQGRRVRERRVAGEIEARPHDVVQRQDTVLARLVLTQKLPLGQVLRAATAPTFTTRSGDERIQAATDQRDPQNAQRDLRTLVSGLEHEVDLFGGLVENIAFVKSYVLQAKSEEQLPGGVFRALDRVQHFWGVGDGLRVKPLPWLYAKGSYEWATRLPGPPEVFGDGVLILPNLALQPERSHNANASIHLDLRETPLGSFRGETNAFLRRSDDLIVMLGNDRVFQHQNVYAARSWGLESAIGWSSPGEHLVVDANATWMDLRNDSDDGAFEDYEGDRIPNRPWLFGNLSWRAQQRSLLLPGDEAALFWSTQYTHDFFRGWESQGLREFKQSVPAQLLHGAGATYAVAGPVHVSTTIEVSNLTDARAFDFFGVQRPGRALFLKVAGGL